MFDTFFGLPLHPFIVHATEVIVPLAAALVLLTALWPRARRWAGYLPAAVTLVALVLVPISKESGESLEGRVGENDLIERHAQLADGLLPWVVGLVLVAGLLLAWTIREKRTALAPADTYGAPVSRRAGPRWVPIVLIVLALIASTGTTVQAVLIGHSGATAVWQEDMSGPPRPATPTRRFVSVLKSSRGSWIDRRDWRRRPRRLHRSYGDRSPERPGAMSKLRGSVSRKTPPIGIPVIGA
ncbi:hypothetical protein GCM10010988_40930 [Cnuibacter physcomitrellae]|uniref:DUF2231 domain-containing protein n=1 Tax=Cnuibacter physcomitrellae TaxID=1619308 RepID=UPI00157C5425|nr:DUF2231 domain-containing protein [Cnuibacter physcomitrellae]GGI42814.1 hypothetical protein GCM10010988_40930 [Cnuibacter physcomitrellae]